MRALAEAAADGDRAAAFRLLAPETRARLEADARRAGELAGGRALKAEELLAVGWFPPRFRAGDVREKSRDGDRATVEVRGEKGEREDVTCVRENGAWKVELP